ncbi:MAG: ferritin [Anaerolineales bacterium]
MNDQIGSELSASSQYLQLASYFASDDLPELAAFFFRQADEEREHALKFVHYLVETGGQVAIPEVMAAKDVSSVEEAVQAALDGEKKVTDQINNLSAIAAEEQDFAALRFLGWFSEEQIEEVSTMTELLGVVRRAGDQLLLVEEYVARRGDPHG